MNDTKARLEQEMATPQRKEGEIPQERIELLARPLLAAVRRSFEDPAVVAEYEQWKAERDARIQQK